MSNPRFRGLYLRREAQYLGDAIDKSASLYPALGARLVRTPRIVWTFPSGATLWFNHCEHENDVRNYDSFEFSLVLWDELTHFTEKQYRGVNARLRGTDSTLPYWSRAATNPGGEGHAWVFNRWGAWLNPKHPRPAEPGALRWYQGDEAVEQGAPDSLSRTFIPALLQDNPHITADYRAKLLQLDPLRRAQLARGDWLAQPAAKGFWDRAKLQVLSARPANTDVIARVRAWDFGATTDGDATAGVLIALTRQRLPVIEHCEHFRGRPDVVRERFGKVAEADRKHDPRTVQVIPQDPGQAGVDQVASYQREHPGITIRARRPTGEKSVRFGPVSGAELAGNVAQVQDGAWDHDAFNAELEAFPLGAHDDRVDATADAHAQVTDAPGARFMAATDGLKARNGALA